MKQSVLILFVVFVLVLGCNRNTPPECTIMGSKDIRIHRIELDSAVISLDGTSLIGELKILHNQLCFVDEQFASVWVLNDSLKLDKRHLGLGKGPNELFGITWISEDADSGYVIQDNSCGLFYKINSHWEKKDQTHYDQNSSNLSETRLMYFTKPWMKDVYNLNYCSRSMVVTSDNKVIVPLFCGTYAANSTGDFYGGDVYYESYFSVGQIDLKTGKLDTMFITRPPIYRKEEYKYLAIFDVNELVLRDSTLWVMWAVDSLIYEYSYPDNLVGAFGYQGRNMNTQYTGYKSFKETRDNYERERTISGHYTILNYDASDGLLFRGYEKGRGAGTGLQIYDADSHALIGDLNMPHGFKFMGKKDGTYYGCSAVDEYAGTIVLYHFKLNL